MNIKLDKDVRIRLDQEDVKNWKSRKYLEQEYKFGLKSFKLEVKLDPKALRSHIVAGRDGLAIVLGYEDSIQLCKGSIPKSGISIDEVNIQVDQWDIEMRSKHEDRMKGR